jgi:hypothetical protein
MRKGLGGLRKIVNSAILKKFGRRAHFFICVEIQATPLMNPSFQRTLLVTVAGILLVLAGWTGHEIHVLSAQEAAIKKDYSIVNSIGNGLLSVGVWRDEIMKGADYQLSHFELDEASMSCPL